MKKNSFVFACSFFFSLGGNILNFSLIYRLTDSFSFNPGQIGSFIALGQFFYFIGCNLYHRLAHHLDPAKVFPVSALTVLAMALPLSFVKIRLVAYISYWVLNLATGLYWPPVMAWLTSGLDNKGLNREISIFNRSWMGANIAGPLVAGTLYRWNNQSTFVLLNLSYLTVIVLLFLMRRRSRSYGAAVEMPVPDKPALSPAGTIESAGNETETSSLVNARSAGADENAARTSAARSRPESPVLKALDRKLDLYRYRGWMSGVCSSMFVGILVNIIPLHIRDGLGYTERAAGMILFFRCISGFTGFTVLARFTAWQFNRRWFIILQCGLIACTLLLLAAGNRLSVFAIVAVLYGILNSCCYNNSIFYSGATGKNPKKNLALHEIFLCIGNATGTAGGGFFYQHFRFAGMSLALLIALGLGLGAFIVLGRRSR